MTQLFINEVFGPTFQGEGTTAGRHCLFVRLAKCNLECRWCDTPQTWAFNETKAAKHIDDKVYDEIDEVHEMFPLEVVDQLKELWPIDEQPTTVVITGGEPLMQQQGLGELVASLDSFDCPIQIETAGTILPVTVVDNYVTQYNVSPKLANSGNLLKKRRKEVPLRFFSRCDRAFFKFVCADVKDLTEVDEIVDSFEIPLSHVQIMTEGIDANTICTTALELSDEVLKRGYGLTLREHILIWGNLRGV